ncbi:MAG TPA: RNA polymerase sigma-54 factor, partial [Xanthobacteraceae bacterium]|nr:RNA polymerase sigma-54 factor [Xanthobacteraceae bacterium]
MALTQKLQIRQSQALVMTPQLLQAIKLLQLSNLDLVAYVEAELERNPLLERGSDEEPTDGPETAPAADGTAEDGAPWNNGQAEPGATIEERFDAPLEDVFPDDAEPIRARAAEGSTAYSEWAGVGRGGRDDCDYNLEAFVSAETTLADWLREQFVLAVADPTRRLIGQYLIDLVDEAGYLSSDLTAAAERLGTSVKEVEAVLAILQSLDPPGVCARDLAECLALQLKER